MVYQNILGRKKLLACLISLAANQWANAEETKQAETDEIVVTGVRASQAKAIDIKRESSKVVDSIVAEDIGKLPDTTITDSLQRVTGVQIKREANEGTSLNVRGMPQVLTTLNGEQFLSPWNITDVGANYSDIPASMIRGVDVFKSQSASTLGGGIAGVIDLKTIAPLSLTEGFKGNLKIEGSKGTRSDKEIQSDGTYDNRSPDYNLGFFSSYNKDGQYGLALSGFKSSSYNANYSIWQKNVFAFLDQKNGTPTDPLDLDGDGDLINDWYLVPEDYGASSRFMERNREGLSLTGQAKVGDFWSLRADVFYTRMDQFDRNVEANFTGVTTPYYYAVNNTQPAPAGTYFLDAAKTISAPVPIGTDGKPNADEKLNNTLLKTSTLGNGGQFSYVDAKGVPQSRQIHSVTIADVFSPDFVSRSKSEINRTGAINSNFQADYDNENIKASVRYVHAEAEKQKRVAQLQQGKPGWSWIDADGKDGKDPVDPFHVVVNYTGKYPSFNFDKDVSSAELLEQYQADATAENVKSKLDVFRLDGSYAMETGILTSIDAGVRFDRRQAEKQNLSYITPTGRYHYWDERIPEDKRGTLYPGNYIWQRYPDWRYFDYNREDKRLTTELSPAERLYDNQFRANDPLIIKFTDFGPFNGFQNGVSSVNPSVWDNTLEFMNRLYPGTKTVENPAYTYEVIESTSSVFGQANFADELWGIEYKADAGLRIQKTNREVTRKKVPEVLDIFNSIGYDNYQKLAYVFQDETLDKSFTQFLPSININIFPTEDWVARFAIAKTTTRNNLDNIGAGPLYWYSDCVKTDKNGVPIEYNNRAETVGCVGGGEDKGNINIKPWAANVFNSSAEWYFAENSILGVGLFYIDVNESVQEYQVQRNFTDADGVNRGNTGNVYISDNVGASSLYGIELGYKQPFTFLPGNILSSTGMEFNYTYSQSDSGIKDLEGNSLPLKENSSQQANLIVWYDKHGVNLRLAYNWRSREFSGYSALNTSAAVVNLGDWVDPAGYLDFSASYWLNENLSFNFSATNLTEESKRTYSQYSDQLQSMWVQERRFNLGATLSY
ncbi:MAG: hypothetical protein RL497_1966 [Pseudomonadota bacterium]